MDSGYTWSAPSRTNGKARGQAALVCGGLVRVGVQGTLLFSRHSSRLHTAEALLGHLRGQPLAAAGSCSLHVTHCDEQRLLLSPCFHPPEGSRGEATEVFGLSIFGVPFLITGHTSVPSSRFFERESNTSSLIAQENAEQNLPSMGPPASLTLLIMIKSHKSG